MTDRIDLYDSTGDHVGFAVRNGEEFFLYDKHGKLVARVSSKTTPDHAIKIILGSLPYLC